MRVVDWEIALNDAVERHRTAEFAYGASDCFILMADVVEAITGERPYGKLLYSSAQGAAGQLKRRGFTNVEEMIAAKFPRVEGAFAQRGDLVILDHEGEPAGGVVIGSEIIAKSRLGTLRVPVSVGGRFYRVE